MPDSFCECFKRQLEAIKLMMAEINQYRIEPAFSEKVAERQSRSPDYTRDDAYVLHRCIDLIAYSNNANSELVKPLLESGIFSTIFQEYSVIKSAGLDSDRALQSYWPGIKAIRFKYKVERMIGCAKRLLMFQERFGTFMGFLKSSNLPERISTEQDINQFWDSFDNIRNTLSKFDFPYFKNFTSLCHLLMDLGFDCAKPDLAVMKAAVKLNIVPPAPVQRRNPNKTGAHPESSLRQAIRMMQTYAICRGSRPAVVDMYFLVCGGQKDMKKVVSLEYYS